MLNQAGLVGEMNPQIDYQEMRDYFDQNAVEWHTMAFSKPKRLEFQLSEVFRVSHKAVVVYEGVSLKSAVEVYNRLA